MTEVNPTAARKNLERAFECARSHRLHTHCMSEKARWLLLESTHKTYKYIFVNALVARASANVNPLSLQKGSELPRSWDARSLCHKVLVPFERDFLDGRLGSSQEPFLNKPARVKELSLRNPVRKGKDTQALTILIELLGSLKGADDSFKLLTVSLQYILEIPPQRIDLHNLSTASNDIHQLLNELICEGVHGEALLFAVALCLTPVAALKKCDVKYHPSNQSGASSNEVLDIDIYYGGNSTPVLSIEVKDKKFGLNELSHSVDKCLAHGVYCMIFVSKEKYVTKSLKLDLPKGFHFQLVSELDLIKYSHFVFNLVSEDDIAANVEQFLKQARPKIELLQLIKRRLGSSVVKSHKYS